MNVGIRFLKGFAYVWCTLAAVFIGACLIMVWIKEGFSKVQEIMSPFNVLNFIVIVVTLAPGLGAFWLAEKLKQKQLSKSEPSNDRGG